VGARQRVRGRAQIPLSVVQDEVFEVHQLALQPQAGAGVHKMRPVHHPFRMGLIPKRSSRRAKASSAAASGSASALQGSGSGIA
jgi:hypothetical protein